MRAASGFEPSDKWFGQQAVYRISFGNFVSLAVFALRQHTFNNTHRCAHTLNPFPTHQHTQQIFFSGMALALLGVRHKGDKRGQAIQHGGWGAKLALWLLCCALPFFFPAGLVAAYGWLARVGSGAFLIIQMIILLDFCQAWNDAWVARGEDDERWLYGLLGLTVAAFAGVLALSGELFSCFVIDDDAVACFRRLCTR